MRILLIAAVLVSGATDTARAEPPDQLPPTPTPLVTNSPPPRMPYVTARGRPSFSVITRDEGPNYNVYVTVGNAEAKNVQVSIHSAQLWLTLPPSSERVGASAKAFSLPHDAILKVAGIKRGKHSLKIIIPKKKGT